MYIKLTRLDGSPIWLNASFIVTIEPGRNGGSVVVPIGDGLDYDVREAPEAVLAALADAPVATVVPVPAPKGLTSSPDDVSPGGGIVDVGAKGREAPAAGEPKAVAPAAAEADAAAKPAARKSRAKVAGAETPEKGKFAAKPRKRGGRKLKLDLDDDQLARLRKMAPGSVRKLLNTIVSQFKVADAEHTVKALVDHEIVSVDEQDHVSWLMALPAPSAPKAEKPKAEAETPKAEAESKAADAEAPAAEEAGSDAEK